MGYHVENGLHYEIIGNEASLVGFASGSSLAKNNIPDLVIPDIVRGVPVTTITANAFDRVDELETITIPSTLKKIDECAFLGCQRLIKITMSCPKAKKDTLKICSSAFAYCFSLEEVDIFCELEIEARAFLGCDKLKNIHGVIDCLEENAFRDCNRIYMLNLQHNAKIKFDAFSYCTIENIRCLGDVVFSANDIQSLIDNRTIIHCYQNSKTTELAYIGLPIKCISNT